MKTATRKMKTTVLVTLLSITVIAVLIPATCYVIVKKSKETIIYSSTEGIPATAWDYCPEQIKN